MNGSTTDHVSDELLEQVVREVLRRLQSPPPPAPPRTAAVVTLDDVVGRAESGPLLVAPRAVVTPAARDWLRERGIEIVRQQANHAPKSKPPVAVRVVLATSATRFEPADLAANLRRAGHEVEQLARGGLVEVVAELADRVARGGDRGLLATDETHAALCLANRRAGVRAVTAADRTTLDKAVGAVGANLLVIDTSLVRPHLVRTLAIDFCRGGPRECPPALTTALAAQTKS